MAGLAASAPGPDSFSGALGPGPAVLAPAPRLAALRRPPGPASPSLSSSSSSKASSKLVVAAAAGVVAAAGAVAAVASTWDGIGRPIAGGAVIGAAAVFFMAMSGRIAGYSGITYNAVTFKKDDWVWRWVYVGGTVAAGAVVRAAGMRDTFAPLPIAGDWPTIVISGLLVGYGTVLGGGCTSGHGVCGMSRLSIRSIVGVITFMATGVLTATIAPLVPRPAVHVLAIATLLVGMGVSAVTSQRTSHPPSAASVAGKSKPAVPGGAAAMSDLGWVSMGRLAVTRAAAAPAPPPSAPSTSAISSAVAQLDNWRELVVALAAGATFGLGLAASAMTSPAAVLQFLRLDAATWSPNLAFVMASATAVASVGYYLTFQRSAPACGPTFHLPTETRITPSLIAGSGAFGVGWGLSGICPGPGIVSLVLGNGDYYGWFVAMLCGMWAYYGVTSTAMHIGARPALRPKVMAAAMNPILNPFASTMNLFDGAPSPSPSPSLSGGARID